MLWLVAQVSSVAHMAFVQHMRCAEHGAWVHASNPLEAKPNARAGVPQPSLRTAPGEDAPCDEHCVVGLEHRRPAAPFHAFAETIEPNTATWAWIPTDRGGNCADSVYGFAPKTSPPRFA